MLLVGRDGRWLLGLMLTSKVRTGQPGARPPRGRVSIGTGPWDRQRRPSEVKVDRIIRVNPRRIRREGATLDAERFAAVVDGVRQHR